MESNNDINNQDISLETLRNLLSNSNESLFGDLDITKAIEESENLVKKNIDEIMNQFKDFKTDIYFVNKSSNPDPIYAHKGDSGFDLRANLENEITLKSFERILIPTGLYFETPSGYDIEIKSRSGLAVKNGITVLTGTIDQNYRGEIKVLLFNSSKEDFIINNGDRIAQALIRPILCDESVKFNKVFELNNSNRMNSGFGSTGVS